MKILLTVHQFLPDYSAGTEILTLDTARDLRRLGHEVFILSGHPAAVALPDDQRFEHYEYDGLPVVRFQHSHVPMGGQTNTTAAEYNNWLVAAYLRRFLRRNRPDIVHFFHLARLSGAVIDVCHELGIPMVATPTDFWFICPTSQLRLPDHSLCTGPDANGVNCLRHVASLNQPARLQAKLRLLPDWALGLAIWATRRGFFSGSWFAPQLRALAERPGFLRERLNMLERVLVPTHLMERILVNNGLRPEKVIYKPYGIELKYLRDVVRNRSENVRLGFIGTLYEHKGAHILLQAVKSLPDAGNLELRIYGRRDEFPAYVQQLDTLAAGDPRIKFCGTFANDKIGEVLGSLDALVVPSLWYENTPLVVYSAQAAKCPVIASDTPGLAEAIQHDVNGLLFERGNPLDLAKLLQIVISDRTILERLSEHAPAPKSIHDYVGELDSIYSDVLSSFRGKPVQPFPAHS